MLEWSDTEGIYALRADARYQGIDSRLSLSIGDTSVDLRLWWDGQPLSNLASLEAAPPELQWLSGGRFAHDVTARFPDKGATDIGWTIELSAVDFDSPDGRFAAAALEGTSSGRLLAGDENEVAVTGAIRGGEILLGNFYSDFSAAPLQFELQPSWEQDGTLTLPFRVHDDGALTTRGRVVSGSGEPDPPWDVYIEDLRLDFPLAYERYVEPIAAAWDLDGLEVTGAVSWRGSWLDGALNSGDLDITDLSAVDTKRGRFAVTGLQTRLRLSEV